MVARAMQADRKAAVAARDELRREKLARDYATEQWRNEEKARKDLETRVRDRSKRAQNSDGEAVESSAAIYCTVLYYTDQCT